MDFLRRNYKHVIAVLLILIFMEMAVSYYLVNQFHENYLRGAEAFAIVLEDAGLTEEEAGEPEITLGHKKGTAWYTIRFEAGKTSYVYEIDAEDGHIRSSETE